VSQENSSITQLTFEGGRSIVPLSFSYDSTFGEDSSTRDVYVEVVEGIVKSVVDGYNG
jgi:hypothetical protein